MRRVISMLLLLQGLPSLVFAAADEKVDFADLRQVGACSVSIEAQGVLPGTKLLIFRSRKKAQSHGDKIRESLSSLRPVLGLAEPMEFAGELSAPKKRLHDRPSSPATISEARDGGIWHYQLFYQNSPEAAGALKAPDLTPASITRSIYIKDCGGVSGEPPMLDQAAVIQAAAQILAPDDKRNSSRIWFSQPDPKRPCRVDVYYLATPPKGASDPAAVKSGRAVKIRGKSSYTKEQRDYEPISVYDFKEIDDYPALRVILDKRFNLVSNLPFPKGVLVAYRLTTDAPQGGWEFSAIERLDMPGVPARDGYWGAASKTFVAYGCDPVLEPRADR